MCNNDLKSEVDFTWTPSRSSFAVDWGIYCDTEAQKSNINSFYFVGGFVGLMCSAALLEKFGRKRVTVVTGLIAVFATLSMAFATNIYMMIGLRVVLGLGLLICFISRYIWVMEFSPQALRNFTSTIMMISWPIGSAFLTLISFFIADWKTNTIAIAAISFVLLLNLFFEPESPRYYLQKGDTQSAAAVLNKLARFYGTPTLPESCLQNITGENKKAGMLEQLRAFLHFPVMRTRTLVLIFCWFGVALVYYGLSFGWHKIGKNIFASQGFACVSEIMAITSTYFLIQIAGRKKMQLFSFLAISLCFGLAMIDLQLSSSWDLQQVICLIAILFITTEFAVVYLYTVELSPTSHRGLITFLCSAAARIGSFTGPYITLLFDLTNRRVVLGAMGGIAMVAGVLTLLLLEDTTGLNIPETPPDLQPRKEKVEKGYEELQL